MIANTAGPVRTRWKKKIPAFKLVMLGSFCLSLYTILLSLHTAIDGTESVSILSLKSLEYPEDKVESEMELDTIPRHNRNLQYSDVLDYLGMQKQKLRITGAEAQLYNGEQLDEDQQENKSHSGEDNLYPSQLYSLHVNETKSLPQAIIIGVKKGGTRALLEFLRLHPKIRAPGPEPHFFDKNYEKGLEWYREQMPATTSDQVTMEKTPSYFVTKDVPRRIFKMSSDTKLIVVVRDPVTRAISDYTQAIAKRPAIKSFEEFAFLDNSSRLVDTSWGAIKIGVYAKHLEKWLQFFPMEQFHFVSGEELISNPAQELTKVQKFLGLDRLVTKRNFHLNGSKGFPCLRKFGSGKPHCLDKSKGRPHPHINSDIIRRLRDFYKPFNAKFYQMCGRDFGWL